MKPIKAAQAPVRAKPSHYPEPFASRMAGRTKRPLGDLFGLAAFGVNLTELAPGAESALLHKHSKQEEFVYVLSGNPTLILDGEEHPLSPGDCAGFSPAGPAHRLVNRSAEKAVYLEVGTRMEGDQGTYPEDDLVAVANENGSWSFRHKDGRPY